MREYLEELRDNWRNTYWWADHWIEQAVLVGAVLMFFELLTTYLKTRMVGSE